MEESKEIRVPVAFAWRRKGSTDPHDWRVCWDIEQALDSDVLKLTEIKFLYE